MLLQVSNLKTYFESDSGLVRAVDGVSFELNSGETLGIVGESGCGKSVTALTINRLLPTPPAVVAGGSVQFDGMDLLALSESEMCSLRGNDIGMIFQEPMTSLNPVYTVGFQIAEGLRVHRPDWTQDRIKERVLELFSLVGIPEADKRYSDYPHQMSGGMRQRVMIAMALSCEPKLLIADEPTTALDVTIQAQILDLIRDLQKKLGMAVMLITHDLGVVANMVDKVMVMYAGKVVESAAVKALFQTPRHPYTLGLLDSLPSRQKNLSKENTKRIRLKAIKGNVPNLTDLPTGCSFQNRCDLVQTGCREKDPTLEDKGDNHSVSCFEV